MWIKICGITDSTAALTAARAGADAVGLVFSPSVRQISIDRAERLLEEIPGELQTVAVLRKPDRQTVMEVMRRLRPDYLQSDQDDWQNNLQGLKPTAGCRFLPVLRNQLPDKLPPICLFEGTSSGRGRLADWRMAARIAQRIPLILAGGLTPGNVADAIREVRPFGVDVSSGVERNRGEKSSRLIEEFVHAARQAAAEVDLENAL
ncbi:MAG: phosphoribosylanthranilate isomerase [Gammaproteobacteria bacterium]|nr:phosphoribosylanthranilate isomerase [Gammaproteobacteria bacterium]